MLLGPTKQSHVQSFVFAPECVEDPAGAAVAWGPSGNGCIGYIGDVTAEEDRALFVMFNWVFSPQNVGSDSKAKSDTGSRSGSAASAGDGSGCDAEVSTGKAAVSVLQDSFPQV